MGFEQKRKEGGGLTWSFFPRSRQCNARSAVGLASGGGADPVRHCLRHVPRRAEVVREGEREEQGGRTGARFDGKPLA